MVDFKKIAKSYRLAKNLRLQDIKVLIKAAKKRKYQPREALVLPGTRHTEISFITKGLVRGYMVNEKGEDITMMLRWESQIVASPFVLFFDQLTRGTVEAVEPTTTLSIEYDVLQKIVEGNPRLLYNQKNVFEQLMKDAVTRLESFLLYTPEERYEKFLETHADLVNRVPDKYIAHMLGITPVSLSRIRKRLTEKKTST